MEEKVSIYRLTDRGFLALTDCLERQPNSSFVTVGFLGDILSHALNNPTNNNRSCNVLAAIAERRKDLATLAEADIRIAFDRGHIDRREDVLKILHQCVSYNGALDEIATECVRKVFGLDKRSEHGICMHYVLCRLGGAILDKIAEKRPAKLADVLKTSSEILVKSKDIDPEACEKIIGLFARHSNIFESLDNNTAIDVLAAMEAFYNDRNKLSKANGTVVVILNRFCAAKDEMLSALASDCLHGLTERGNTAIKTPATNYLRPLEMS